MNQPTCRPTQSVSGNPFLASLEEHLSTNDLAARLHSWPLAES